LVSDENVKTVIKIAPEAELYLLDLISSLLPQNVIEHILEQVSYYIDDGSSFQETPAINENSLKFLEEKRTLIQAKIEKNVEEKEATHDCNDTPIKGDDVVPQFNVDTDDFGCFKKKQYANNCYNYGSDILTNTFAQPGRGTGHKWTSDTCESVTKAAISDGLIWYGTDYPSKVPEFGHYIALLIWPNSNFHWVRLDSNGKWSHKPGGTEVKNTDNDGNLITDPSKQDFSPWSQFCGYFNIIPSKTTVN